MSAGAKLVMVAGVVGVLFGVGLVLSGMTQAEKVISFLDVSSGAWDPSLIFVMIGAIGVHAALFRLIVRRPSPLFDASFHLPTRTDIDRRLIVGAALFGIGWGLGGICPGPGLVAAASFGSSMLLFVGGMLAGMALFQKFQAT